MPPASVQLEQPQAKLSFAKVAASTYKPPTPKDTPAGKPPAMPQPQASSSPAQGEGGAQTVLNENSSAKEKVDNKATGTKSWPSNSEAAETVTKEDELEKPCPSINLIKSSAPEDNATQLSSSDGSAKPPSLDGKSVASATTFALDEKESIRPDDSASLRAVEEEDVASPPESVAAGSRVGSDIGARAFRDQLHEIAVMGPSPLRGAPPGRFPHPNTNSNHGLYDSSQPRSMSQPPAAGMPSTMGPHDIPPVPDEKLIEALESPRDRLFVLKLEQDFIDFVKNNLESELSLPNCNTFYRMLAHRLADYYLLGHVVDNTMTGVKITKTPFCRVPPPLSGLPTLAKNANTPPVDLPARKIMRRGDDAKSGTNTTANSEGPSKTTSEAGGGSGSENGNDGENKEKSALTREQREARYREARQRIFGNSEGQDGESTDAGATSEEKDISRSSSASGKKKTKKQRNYDDDGFEARSRYTSYYPPQFPVGYNGDGSAMFYGAYQAPVNAQYPGMAPNVSPPPSFNGYAVMLPQDQQAYGWPSAQYQPSNGAMGYTPYGTVPNGYDLSADFQRGMQSFQSAGMPTQVTPKMSSPQIATYPEPYQQPNMPMNQPWTQMSPPQQPYPMNQPPYPQTSPNGRPISTPIQGPVPPAYGYGHYPTTNFNAVKPNRNQHPLPGSFNRQQFNPQSQAFVPGGRNGSFPMQPNIGPVPPQGINNFGNMTMPMQPPMARPNAAAPNHQPFGSPHGEQNGHPLPAKVNNHTPSPAAQTGSTQSPAATQSNNPSVPAQSSIAKWGTPAHLPPKPPAPPQPQAPKFNLPGHSFPPVPRHPNGVPPAFPANGSMIRGGPPSGGPPTKP